MRFVNIRGIVHSEFVGGVDGTPVGLVTGLQQTASFFPGINLEADAGAEWLVLWLNCLLTHQHLFQGEESE